MVCLCAGHTEKIYWVRYHPLAKDILATASYDMTVRIWDVTEAEEWLQLEGHTDTVGMEGHTDTVPTSSILPWRESER